MTKAAGSWVSDGWMVGDTVHLASVTRFDAAEKIPAGALVTSREDGSVRAADPGDIPIGIAVRCERGGNGGLVCDVRLESAVGRVASISDDGFLDLEPDLVEDFTRKAEQSLAVVRRQERIVRRRARAKRRRRRR